MTTEHEASRTLVKSPPELWAECSDAGSLARHLGEFGEITITRLEPETTVAWEGSHASGTVQIEPSAWGTRITLTAQVNEARSCEPGRAAGSPDEVPVPEAVDEPVPEAVEEPGPAQKEAVSSEHANSIEEDSHATMEETSEGPDPALAAGVAAPRRRRRRLQELIRSFLRGPEPTLAAPAPSMITAPHAEPAAGEALRAEPAKAPGTREPVDAEAVREPWPEPPAEPEPEPEPPTEADVEPGPPTEAVPTTETPVDTEAVLTAALDSLGQAHHRPFSRA